MRCDEYFSLSAHTTIGVGGHAVALYPCGGEQLSSLLRVLNERKTEYYILGAGSNVLPRDGDYPGIIVSTSAIKGIARGRGFLNVGAGEKISALLRYCGVNGLNCCAYMAGIPASVGGSIYMNAGVSGGHIGDAVKSVTYADLSGVHTVQACDCAFAYKDSAFRHMSACAIVSAELYAETSSSAIEETERYKSARANLPKGKSMGCVFKNPAGASAGRIIDECGLKGLAEGGAIVSEEHANFIINRAGASSKDIKTLIGRVKRAVFLKTGIALEEEIKYI